MENKRFLTAQDVMKILGVSLSYSYKLIRRLNAELEADGFMTIKGRVSKQYFMKRIYGLSTNKEVGQMAVIKNNKTGMWEVRTYYKDLTGARKQKTKRGFAKKSEALEWERNFKLKENQSISMSFKSFMDIYLTDLESRTKACRRKENTNSSINHSDESEGKKDTEQLRKFVAENIKLKQFYEVAEENASEQEIIREIYDTICDIVCFPREQITIKGTSYSWQVVKSQFLKLKPVHIANLLERLVDNSLEIKNMESYLISTLYEESLSGTLKEQAELQEHSAWITIQ